MADVFWRSYQSRGAKLSCSEFVDVKVIEIDKAGLHLIGSKTRPNLRFAVDVGKLVLIFLGFEGGLWAATTYYTFLTSPVTDTVNPSFNVAMPLISFVVVSWVFIAGGNFLLNAWTLQKDVARDTKSGQELEEVNIRDKGDKIIVTISFVGGYPNAVVNVTREDGREAQTSSARSLQSALKAIAPETEHSGGFAIQ